MSAGTDVIESREFLGIRVHSATMQEVLSCCDRAAAGHERLVLGVLNAAKIVKMGQDEALRDAVLSADLILPDGMAVVWASRILREPLPERVPGIDLFERLLGVADRLPCPVDVGLAAAGQPANDRAAYRAGDPADRLEVARRGDREPGLDHVGAEFHQGLRDLELLRQVHAGAGRLLAVAQGGIEDDNPS